MLSDVHKKIYFHIGAWLSFFLIIILSADELDSTFFFKSLSTFIPAFVLFYLLVLWVFPFYLKERFTISVILLTISITICAVFLKSMILKLLYPEIQWAIDRITFWVQFRYNVLFVGVAFAYHYASELIKAKIRSKELEKINADAKLALLKNQLNPHFLYNALSLLYAKSLPHSEELATLTGRISEILRYSLEEAQDGGGFVAIDKEIEHIKNYIHIQSQRFGSKLDITFDVHGNSSDRKIAPMLLITLIENAFKHGDLQKSIAFSLSLDAGIEFTTVNKIKNDSASSSSGLGLKNVKARLELIYPEKHKLLINEEQGSFYTHLKIFDQ